MRLHTNILTRDDLYKATADLPGVSIKATEHGSRSHARGFEVHLTGTSNSRPNREHWADEYAATWDEWGVAIARLYDIDPDAVWGGVKNPIYDGSDDFHFQTGYRFEGGQMPKDTHKRHNWQYVAPREFACKTCTAERSGR